MCVRVGEKCGWCKVGDTTQLAQQADLGVFGGLCEELEALCGMQARERRLEECCGCMGVLKMCIFVLPHVVLRLQLLAKAPQHAQIRLLRQLRRSTDFASAALFPCTHAHNATL